MDTLAYVIHVLTLAVDKVESPRRIFHPEKPKKPLNEPIISCITQIPNWNLLAEEIRVQVAHSLRAEDTDESE